MITSYHDKGPSICGDDIVSSRVQSPQVVSVDIVAILGKEIAQMYVCDPIIW